MTERVFSFSYCIPDECIVQEIPQKTRFLAPYLPGDKYAFNHRQEAEYYKMYQKSLFAITQRKGGWDCLRHYEIMANGCVPIFMGLDKCPTATLEDFPKRLVMNAMDALEPWNQQKYNEYVEKMLTYMRKKLSCSSNAIKFLRIMEEKSGKKIRKVLMLTGDMGVNYSRELFWIGLKRMLGEGAMEYPRLNFLYSDYPQEGGEMLYGNGFTYSRRITSVICSSISCRGSSSIEAQITASIEAREWDIIVYGKVGPDEGIGGSMSNMPFWSLVERKYGRDEIAFIYGGDGCQDMTRANQYSAHLLEHCNHGICFVREINTE